MLAYLIRRVLIAIPVLLGILAMTFILVHMLPGDPATVMLTPEELQGNPEFLEMRRAELGLHRQWQHRPLEAGDVTELRRHQLLRDVLSRHRPPRRR